MKNFAPLLASVLLLTTTGCAFFAGPPGGRPASPPNATGASATASVDPNDEVPPGEEPAPSPSATVSASASTTDIPPLDTAALCTKASTCTTTVSLELCGMLNPKCLDAFHKHADGADRASCQAKLDRLPKLVEEWGRPGYALPAECR
jgi:hypothetical protein